MKIKDIIWNQTVNHIYVECDCGKLFWWPTNITLIECKRCGKKEWWNDDGLGFNEVYGNSFKVAKMSI